MSRKLKCLFLALLLWICVDHLQMHAQNPLEQGLVHGHLKTDDGEPAAGFTVDIIGTSATSTWRKRVLTNEEGAFEFDQLNFGEYVIAPYLEGGQSRYPAGTLSFYNPKPVRIRLSRADQDDPITIRLNAPNRILSGTVVSSSSGSPVLAAIQLEYQNDSDRSIRFSTSHEGLFRVLVPASAILIMRTSAPGYASNVQAVGPVGENTDPQLAVSLTALPGR